MHTDKTLRQLLGRYYIALQVCLVIALLLVARYFAIMYGLDSITLTSLSSSIISGAVFVVGFLLVGVFSDYKEADKLPAEIRSILESIIAEGDTLLRKDATFDADNQVLKETVVRFIDEFEQGLSHDKDHSHIEHAMDEIKKFDVVFDSMEKRGVPPNYMTRIKTEQSNLKKNTSPYLSYSENKVYSFRGIFGRLDGGYCYRTSRFSQDRSAHRLHRSRDYILYTFVRTWTDYSPREAVSQG
jgi:hypothetical protein